VSEGITALLASGAILKLSEKDGHLELQLQGYGDPFNRVTTIEPEEWWRVLKFLIGLSNPDAVWELIRDRVTTKLYTLEDALQLVAEQQCRTDGLGRLLG
jgi:hypothetical protein